MTEDNKSELLNHINSTAKILDSFKKELKELHEKFILIENTEEIKNSIDSQLKLINIINSLHKIIHIYIDVADQEGYEFIWEGLKAIKIVEKEDKEDEK